jgi:phosphoserine phosphatase
MLVEWAKRSEVDVFVVSASVDFAVRVGVRHLGIGPEHVIGMRPARDGATILPAIVPPIVYAEGKIQALSANGVAVNGASGRALLGAFGDSGWDAPMLRAARVPVAVAPAPALLEAAATIERIGVLTT